MTVSQSSLSLTTHCIDPHLAGVLVANMLEAWLTAGSALELSQEDVDEHQDHHAASGQAGIHLYPPVDTGPGAAQSGEYRAPVCVEGPGAGAGLAGDCDPDPGPGSRPVGRPDDGPRGLQDTGDRCLDGTCGCGLCAGGVAPGTLEPGLASPARAVCAYTYPGHRLRRVLRPGRLQRRAAAGPQRHNGAGRTPFSPRAPPGRQ